MTYTIGEISKRTRLTISQLRFYDKEGLMPYVKRNASGNREFTESDAQFLGIITCLKKSGMPLKRIRQFVDWVMQGDSTIDARLNFMRQQKKYLERQMDELEECMRVVDGKIEYYEIAAKAGTVAVHDRIGKKAAW